MITARLPAFTIGNAYLQFWIDRTFLRLHRANMLPYKRPCLPLLCMGDKPAITICLSNDWLHRWINRHKGLRQWLRWIAS